PLHPAAPWRTLGVRWPMADPQRPFGPPRLLSRANVRRLELSAMGLYLLVAVLLGLAMGRAVDHWFGTAPWGLLFFLACGLAAGVRNVYRLLKREIDAARHPGPPEGGGR
ncbi:MAG: AtpZ/AtpI family protein, partial [Nitrospirae bacterium]